MSGFLNFHLFLRQPGYLMFAQQIRSFVLLESLPGYPFGNRLISLYRGSKRCKAIISMFR